MNDAERDALWKCAVCGKHYVIRDFARDCEKTHAEQGC